MTAETAGDSAAANAPWPENLRFERGARRLLIRFDDGREAAIPFELLRVESPSAEVQGHSQAEKRLVTGKREVGVERAELVGNYAVRIVFDDGHDSGIYSWDTLRRFTDKGPELMAAYEARLAAARDEC